VARKRPELDVEIMKVLAEYTEDVQKGIEKAADKRAKEAVKTLKTTSPRSEKNHPHYADGWKVKKSKENGSLTVTIYNQKKPHLTHLLEFGWVMKSGKRKSGRAHIEPVQEELNREFAADCEEIIKNGG
jgi:threonyl-tRNA synthetase